MQAPTVSYNFFMKDAYMFYCKHNDTMNFIADDESRVEVGGIDISSVYTMIGNAICTNEGILDELPALKPHQLERTQEMINKLQAFLDKNSK